MLRINLGQVLRHEWSESKAAAKEIYTFVRYHNWKKTLRWMFQRKYWKWWILLAVVIIASVTLSAFHQQIATAIHPWATRIARKGWTWIIPVLALFIVSFPPLFGHELILLVCGMIWGLWRGFLIAAAGTFIGELGTYVAFKYFFRKKAQSLEENHIIYACCAKMMRDGGLPMLILVRFSAMPGHIVTAIQSCIGIGIMYYAIAAFVTLPKQFALVYLGKIFGDTVSPLDFNTMPEQQKSATIAAQAATKRQQKKISFIVFAVTIVATGIAAYIVFMRARALRPTVVAEMEARKLAREEEEAAQAGSDMRETRRQRSQRRRHSIDEGSLGPLKPPEFVDLLKWNQSKPGLLMTPTSEYGHSREKSKESALGMSHNTPSLPHLPRYNSSLVDGEEMLLMSRRSSNQRSSLPVALDRASGSSATLLASEPDYFSSRPLPSSSSSGVTDGLGLLGTPIGEDASPIYDDRDRRRSEPNWLKQDWQ